MDGFVLSPVRAEEVDLTKEKHLRALFVEDSEDDMEILLENLRDVYAEIRHHRVDSAPSLRAALEAGERWDVVICDHNLPSLDAPAALKILQSTKREIPFIIVSGSIGDDTVASAMRAGAVDAICKDNLARLAPAVERELKKVRAILKLEAEHQYVSHVAYYDDVTSLPNREYLAREAEKLIQDPASARMAILFININRFQQIASSFGVLEGNLVLQIIGRRLWDCLGRKQIVARLGGDRFAVLLKDADEEDKMVKVIETVKKEMSEAVGIQGHEYFLSCSIGISRYPDDGVDFQELLSNAETAMYQSRRLNTGGHLYFEPAMRTSGQKRLVMEHALHRAQKQNEFLLHYQPQYDLSSGKIVGVEALLRWQPPEGRLVSPASFIPLLEETGLIVPVGEWVLRTACAQNLAWQQAGLPPIRMAVNLSAIQFKHDNLVAMVQRVLEQTGHDPRFLELEITENVAMYNEEAVISTLTELRTMGISLAIDDFGTGYSSLSYLNRFPVNRLKIDRSFIRGISEHGNDNSIAKVIVALAKNLRLELIAEGVETEFQVSFLRDCECEEVQGFLYSPPVSAEMMEDMIRRAG